MFAPRDAAESYPEVGLHLRIHVVGEASRDLVARAVGVELRRMRIAASLSTAEAAKLLGCNRQHITYCERGECSPRIDTLMLVVRAYHGSLLSIERAVERALAGQAP